LKPTPERAGSLDGCMVGLSSRPTMIAAKHEPRRNRIQEGLVIGVSDPGPRGVVIEVQVPLGTSFQALP
jgi:hypothetical protein